MITSIGLRDPNSIVIPRLGFPFSKIYFSKFSSQISKINNFKSIRIRSCHLSRISIFIYKINKNGSLSLFYKIESWKQIFISHLVCFLAPSEKIFTNNMMQGKKQSNATTQGNNIMSNIMADRPCFVSS
jgi:hypothetical protein